MCRLSPISIPSLLGVFLFVFTSSTAQVPQSVTQPCVSSKSEAASAAKPECVEASKTIKRVKVEFEGLQAFKSADVLKALREDKAELARSSADVSAGSIRESLFRHRRSVLRERQGTRIRLHRETRGGSEPHTLSSGRFQ